MTKTPISKNSGFWIIIFSYLLWGSLPIFWKSLSSIPATVILADRIIWTLVFTVILLIIHKKLLRTIKAINSRKDLLFLIIRSFCLVVNWLVYIWGINHNHIIDCSMGYFICPLTTVLLGCIILKEKLSKWQLISIIIVGLAVFNLIYSYNRIPWIALLIALSFSFYSLFRKTSSLDSLPGLTTEMFVLIIPAIIYLAYYSGVKQQIYFMNESFGLNILVVLTGVLTAAPLLLFANGVRKIKLSTAGLLQYITPTISFLIGVFIYKEQLTNMYLITFSIIWFAVLVFILNNLIEINKVNKEI
ncbi:MAG: EamA family transporter RarD [bacterium]|nr:EamA family transporter RarD [bacterium]